MSKTDLKPLSFCETGFAMSAPWHLRRLSDAGPKYGGGADTPALCGRKVAWDIDVPVTPERLDNPDITCAKCKEALDDED